MTLQELHTEFNKLMYLEDPNLINVVLASIVANSLQIGDPVWLTVIGPSSGGKSQLIRPFAMAHNTYIHRIDDLTPNTLLSGSLGLEGSLLGRVGDAGILSMDDLTVLFSKNAEARGEILSQFRMLYDGHFSKSSGNRKEDVVWTGYLGMIAGSTPSIYRHFSEVADMGERFISYRMKPIDVDKAVDFIGENPTTSRALNEKLADVLREYLLPLLQHGVKDLPELHPDTKAAISDSAKHFSLLRSPIHIDERSGLVDELPDPEMPFRVMKQLSYLALGMHCLQEDPKAPLPPEFINGIEWTAYSMANDKRRAYCRAIAALDYQGHKITVRNVSANTGLHKSVVEKGLSHLQVLKIITLANEEDTRAREYMITNRGLIDLVRKLEPMDQLTIDESW